MRIWSIHPKYLDTKGLVALWRETLLAKHVLAGLTKGYTHHPQLNRFKEYVDPQAAINNYLWQVWLEATRRGYSFAEGKFEKLELASKIPVTTGQVAYETKHLLNKLQMRDLQRFSQLNSKSILEVSPTFELIDGDVAKWEIQKTL